MKKKTIFILFLVFIISFSTVVSANDKLIKAVNNNDLKELKSLVNSGVDVNYQDNKGKTALTYAAELGHPKIAKYLINNETNVKNECKKTKKK